jgi:hypothetical protein
MYKTLIWIVSISALCLGQDMGLIEAHYKDSVKQAQHAQDSIRTIPPVVIAPTRDSSCLTLANRATIDSFDREVIRTEKTLSLCQRIGKIKGMDRLDAIKFYFKQTVITKDLAEYYVDLMLKSKSIEMQGTQYIIDKDCGLGRVRAHAHIKKLNLELTKINDYKFALNQENYKITIK